MVTPFSPKVPHRYLALKFSDPLGMGRRGSFGTRFLGWWMHINAQWGPHLGFEGLELSTGIPNVGSTWCCQIWIDGSTSDDIWIDIQTSGQTHRIHQPNCNMSPVETLPFGGTKLDGSNLWPSTSQNLTNKGIPAVGRLPLIFADEITSCYVWFISSVHDLRILNFSNIFNRWSWQVCPETSEKGANLYLTIRKHRPPVVRKSGVRVRGRVRVCGRLTTQGVPNKNIVAQSRFCGGCRISKALAKFNHSKTKHDTDKTISYKIWVWQKVHWVGISFKQNQLLSYPPWTCVY